MSVKLHFSDYFDVDTVAFTQHGALNICVDADLPVFIDPFLLFASNKPEYTQLHDLIVGHLVYLKEYAETTSSPDIRLFQFPEIRQNWLGVSRWGNSGRGLGPKFARNLITAFGGMYSDFGSESITQSSHIEKLTLLGSGIGRDFISDFTTNLSLEYLLRYTEEFALEHLKVHQKAQFSVRCVFNRELNVWEPRTFTLPILFRGDNDFVVLTPLDMLTKDDSFICRSELQGQFRQIAAALSNKSLRDAVNLFFLRQLPTSPRGRDIEKAVTDTLNEFPQILDHYIHQKELSKDAAPTVSAEKIEEIKEKLIQTITNLCDLVAESSDFFKTPIDSYSSALQRSLYLKQVIEDNDGYRIFYKDRVPFASEEVIQRIFRLTWFGTDYSVDAEVNNGRGPADYKVSYGKRDSTIVEFKLGKSSSLERNLLNQTEIYKKASLSISDIKVILCYSQEEIDRVNRVLKSIDQEGAENIVVIDGSWKESASKA